MKEREILTGMREFERKGLNGVSQIIEVERECVKKSQYSDKF
jgi:hypothetical protein